MGNISTQPQAIRERIVHDPEAIWEMRVIIRSACIAIERLQSRDPTVRCMATTLDELCAELTVELDGIEPELPGVHVHA